MGEYSREDVAEPQKVAVNRTEQATGGINDIGNRI